MLVHSGRPLGGILLTAITFLAALPGQAPIPEPLGVCAVADAQVRAGELEAATVTYSRLVGPDQPACVATGLRDIAQLRADASAADAEGQHLLQQGNLDGARHEFVQAEQANRTDPGALTGLATVNARQRHEGGISYTTSRWNSFYADWFVPLIKLIGIAAIAFFILLAISGLTTRLVVKVDSLEWLKFGRRTVGTISLILMAGAAAMLPIYPMFKPFPARGTWAWKAVLALLVLILAVIGFVSWKAQREGRREQPNRGNRLRWAWRDWGWRLVAPILVIGLAGSLVSCPKILKDPHQQFLTAYSVLVLYSILMSAAVFGQTLRLQVAVQSSAAASTIADPIDTDYLLARMQTLGRESPRELSTSNGASGSTPLSTALSTQDLSALPAGKIVGTLSGLYFALRPDLTWRARAALVDDNRVAVTLTRNGRLATSVIFSRRDLSLPELDDKQSVQRAKAQLLTGAAVIILTELSERHPPLRDGLCGAREWRSVTLQVIATSQSLLDDTEQKIALLARAADEDPGNKLAQLELLWAIQAITPFDDPQYKLLAKDLDTVLGECKKSWTLLRLRALQQSAAQWINLWARYHSYRPFGHNAEEKLKELKEELGLAQKLARGEGASGKGKGECRGRLQSKQARAALDLLCKQTEPIYDAFDECRKVLKGKTPSFLPSSPVPLQAYELACLACLDTGAGYDTEFIMHHLLLAIFTKDDMKEAWEDPCLRSLRPCRRFQQLTDRALPATFLDLDVFATCRPKMRDVGLDTPAKLTCRTQTDQERSELAEYLQVSPILVNRYRKIGQLAETNKHLANVAVLSLFLDYGIDSPDGLRRELKTNRERLIDNLKTRAAETGVLLDDPSGWLP